MYRSITDPEYGRLVRARSRLYTNNSTLTGDENRGRAPMTCKPYNVSKTLTL